MGEPSARNSKDLRGQPLVLPHNEWRVTTKPGKLYFTFFQEPRVPFELPAMKNRIRRAYLLADGKAVQIKEKDGRQQLIVPRPILDPMATVVVVEIDGKQVER
jgi:alpha-L-fucosidase